VEAYRGGYLPNERRKIEQGLRDGSIQGVVSTNALELGIDIGGLDVSILAGFPGSIASTWQQAGRAGRRNTTSLVILVASAAPVDQYLITHPVYLFGASPESAYIHPDNLFILMAHLKCALFELPFKAGSRFGGPVDELLSYLEEEGVCRYAEGTYYWADRSYPAEQVSLRSASNENVVIIDVSCGGGGEVIGEMDRPSAKEMLFEGAVYIHRGEQYMVTRLDIANKRCEVRPCDGNFYTDGIVKRDIKILHRDLEEERMGMNVILGDILVRSQVSIFK
jgi:DEAD/DEAH box helicase domain-containing protein